jgi:DNA modification methylase
MNLLKGDSYQLIKTIPDNSVDLVVIDPPYILETDGAGMYGTKNYNGCGYVMEDIDFMSNGIDLSILDELCRVMKKINIYIWCSQKQLPIFYKYFVENKKCNWNLIAWHKTNPVPSCGNKYLSDTEYCLFFREKGVKIYGSFETKRTHYETLSNKKEKTLYGHPTVKPLNIIKNLIINSSNEGDTVLDCFMGSGTTGVACKELGRHFIGMELEDKYFEIAKNRIENNKKQDTLF